jgi:hypothetical protein
MVSPVPPDVLRVDVDESATMSAMSNWVWFAGVPIRVPRR